MHVQSPGSPSVHAAVPWASCRCYQTMFICKTESAPAIPSCWNGFFPTPLPLEVTHPALLSWSGWHFETCIQFPLSLHALHKLPNLDSWNCINVFLQIFLLAHQCPLVGSWTICQWMIETAFKPSSNSSPEISFWSLHEFLCLLVTDAHWVPSATITCAKNFSDISGHHTPQNQIYF